MLGKYFIIFTIIILIFLDTRFQEKDIAKTQRMKKLAQSSQGIQLDFQDDFDDEQLFGGVDGNNIENIFGDANNSAPKLSQGNQC